jgi:hypothetical protein
MNPYIEKFRDATNSISIHAPTFNCAKCGIDKLLQGRKLLRMDGRKQVWQCKCCAKVAA